MLIEDSFTVHTPVDRLWAFIQDVERIAPCLPGAELTERRLQLSACDL